MFKTYHHFIQKNVHHLQEFAERVWYPQLIALLALMDNIILIVPTDGILISSCLLRPKRWKSFAFFVSLGSTLGALLLFFIARHFGLTFLDQIYPQFDQTTAWVWTEKFFNLYGLIIVFFVSLTPFPQQPAIILAGLARVPINEFVALVFLGRLLKFFVMAYAGSKAPGLLKKMWGLQGELQDVGVKVEK